MTFAGFDPGAVALLDALPGWDADRYAQHRPRLVKGVTQPGAALIAEVAERLDANLRVVPRSSVSPLHRDLRFAAAGTPRYKDHLLLTTWQGADKQTAPVLWIRIDAHHAGFQSSMGFTPVTRERWRQAVAGDQGAALDRLLGRLASARGAETGGEALKRVPASYPSDHPRADLLRRTAIFARFIEPLPDVLDSPRFATWCVERLAALLPIHQWLVVHVAEG